MLLHRSFFLTTDYNEYHQATLLEKGTYSLALNSKVNVLTGCWDNSQKIQQKATLKFLAQVELKFAILMD